jgi:hypothetical protein
VATAREWGAEEREEYGEVGGRHGEGKTIGLEDAGWLRMRPGLGGVWFRATWFRGDIE